MIVEDEEMNYLYLNEILMQTGANITWCKNGQEAVDKILKENLIFDLILMDIKMPVLNGYEATKIIKKYNKNIPVVIQTAYAMPDEKKKGFDAGCDEYLEKPIRQQRLLDTLTRFF